MSDPDVFPNWSLAGYELLFTELAESLEGKLRETQLTITQHAIDQRAIDSTKKFLERIQYGVSVYLNKPVETKEFTQLEGLSALLAFTQIYDELPSEYSNTVKTRTLNNLKAVEEKVSLLLYVIEHINTAEPLPDDVRLKFKEAYFFYQTAEQKAASASCVERMRRSAGEDDCPCTA